MSDIEGYEETYRRDTEELENQRLMLGMVHDERETKQPILLAAVLDLLKALRLALEAYDELSEVEGGAAGWDKAEAARAILHRLESEKSGRGDAA